MSNDIHTFSIILVVSLVTACIRFLPFVLFPEEKELPKTITYLVNHLPSAIIGMLVIYCLKDVTITMFPYAMPEAIAILLVVLSYLWKRNTLFSILVGVSSYMFLLQVVFI